MKRYLFFAYPNYYPSGGAEDFYGDYNSLDEIIALFKNDNGRHELITDDYANGYSIIDTKTRARTVFSGQDFIDSKSLEITKL